MKARKITVPNECWKYSRAEDGEHLFYRHPEGEPDADMNLLIAFDEGMEGYSIHFTQGADYLGHYGEHFTYGDWDGTKRDMERLLRAAEGMWSVWSQEAPGLRENPFESKAQWRACWAKRDPDWNCRRWAHETGAREGHRYQKLPEYKKNSTDHDELYREWKKLVNMTASELERFRISDEGWRAGLTPAEARKQGIKSGQQSAKAIIRMKQKPRSEWTKTDWDWAKRQVSFIKRMRGHRGALYKDGKPTRKHLALKIWGHNPAKS